MEESSIHKSQNGLHQHPAKHSKGCNGLADTPNENGLADGDTPDDNGVSLDEIAAFHEDIMDQDVGAVKDMILDLQVGRDKHSQ